ncbi:MAG: hypothetical protein ACRDGA_00465 [Bacteroidota bacterium]
MISNPTSSAITHPLRRELLLTLVLEVLFYGFLLYLFFVAADRYADAFSYRNPSVVLFVFHSIFLYVHEGGHFLFSFFGTTLAILGGSFWQVMFPLLAFVISLRDRSRIAPFPLFLTGFNLLAVSLYMRDARLRMLPLLGGDKRRHDWWNLFREWNMLDSAESVADVTYYLGILLCVGSIAAGLFLAFYAYLKPKTAPKEMSSKLNQTLATRRVDMS